MVAMARRGAAGMVKHSASIKLKGLSFAWFLRSQRLTWRICFHGRDRLDRLYSMGKPFLICFWHGKYVPIFPLLEGYDASVITNQSKRGSVIAEIGGNFGYKNIQIPNQPGRGAFTLIGEALSGVRACGIAVDGPLGPRYRVKTSVIHMASAFGFDILPVSMGSRRKIVLNGRWDRLELPLPFTRVCLVFGDPIKVPPDLCNGQIRQLASHLTEAITELDDKAQDLVLGNGG